MGYTTSHFAPFHNAANDAWLTLELLFLEAEQAVKQITDPDGEKTIDWMVAPAAPPSSPSRGTIPKEVYDSSLSNPTYPYKLRQSTQSSSPPEPQAEHTPSGSTRRRHKNRNRAKSEVTVGGDTVNSTAATTPTDGNPPAKKQKLTHESDVTEKEGEVVDEDGAMGRNGGIRDGLAGEAEAEVEGQHGEDRKEESAGKPMFVTSGAS